jgi:hypothetical protein
MPGGRTRRLGGASGGDGYRAAPSMGGSADQNLFAGFNHGSPFSIDYDRCSALTDFQQKHRQILLNWPILKTLWPFTYGPNHPISGGTVEAYPPYIAWTRKFCKNLLKRYSLGRRLKTWPKKNQFGG